MDMEFGDDLVGGYSINLKEVVKHNGTMAITKMLAQQLMNNPYVVVSEFIQNISDADLETLIEKIDQNDDRTYEDIILLSEMLATGEGCDASKDMEEFRQRSGHLITLLVIESLGRKRLIRVHRENMSFHEDMKDKIVAERIE